jgi:hypothetical protein
MTQRSFFANSGVRIQRLTGLITVTTALCGLAPPSHAQSAAEPRNERAERLFREGRAALKQEVYDVACVKLAESERLEPAVGTLLNLAVCFEKREQRAAAWSAYRDALELARESDSDDAQRFARQQIATLEADLVRVTLVSPPSPPPGMSLALDGTPLAAERWQRPLALELGVHVIEATAPGRRPWSRTVVALQGGTERVVVIQPPALLTEPGRPSLGAQPPAPQPRSPSVFQARWVVPGAIALVGLAATAYFGASAASAWQTRRAHCPGHACDSTAVDASERAARFARLADVSAVVTATAAVTSVYFGIGWSHERSAAFATRRAHLTPVVQVGGSF